MKPNGTIDRFNARLIAKGYSHKTGINYFDSFSPIAKTITMRLFFAIAASKCWAIEQVDINNAFLHGYLKEKFYTRVPNRNMCLHIRYTN